NRMDPRERGRRASPPPPLVTVPDRRCARRSASDALERLGEGRQTHRAKVQSVGVELLEAEVLALAGRVLLAGGHPQPLADLVRRRLPGPAEVAVALEAEHLVLDAAVGPHELEHLVRVPLL